MGKARSSRRMRNCKSRTKRGGGFGSLFSSKPTNGYTQLDDDDEEKPKLPTPVEEEGVLPPRIRPPTKPQLAGKSRRRHRRVRTLHKRRKSSKVRKTRYRRTHSRIRR